MNPLDHMLQEGISDPVYLTPGDSLRQSLMREAAAEEKPEEPPEVIIDLETLHDPSAKDVSGAPEAPTPEKPEVPESPAAVFNRDAPLQVVAGGVDAVRETVSGLEDLVNYLNGSTLLTLSDHIPNIKRSQSGVANLMRDMTKFAAIFIPVLGTTSKLTQGSSLIIRAGAHVGGAGLADYLASSPEDGHLADTVLNVAPGLRETALAGPLLQFLESDPKDSAAYARFKNVAEGFLLDALTGVVMNPRQVAKDFVALVNGVRSMKTVRHADDLVDQLDEYLLGGLDAPAEHRAGTALERMAAVPHPPGAAVPPLPPGMKSVDRETFNHVTHGADFRNVTAQEGGARTVNLQVGDQLVGQKVMTPQGWDYRIPTEARGVYGAPRSAGAVKLNQVAEGDIPLYSLDATEGILTRLQGGEQTLRTPMHPIRGIFDNQRGSIDFGRIFRGPGAQTGRRPRRPTMATPRRPDIRTKQLAADLETKVSNFRRSGTPLPNVDDLPPAMRVNVEDVRLAKPGTAATQEELAAYGRLQEELADNAVSTAQRYFTHGQTPEALEESLQALQDFASSRAAYIGGTSEAGRSLGATGATAASPFARAVEDIVDLAANGRDVSSLLAQISMLDRGQFANYMTKMGRFRTLGRTLKEAAMEAFIVTRFGFDTITRNAVGNTAFQVALLTERGIAGAGSDIARALGKPGSAITSREAVAMGRGMTHSLAESFRLYWNLAFRPSTDRLAAAAKMELSHVPAISAEAFKATGPVGHFIDAMGYLTRGISRQMIAADVAFRHVAKQGERHALAMREAVKQVRGEAEAALASGTPLTRRQQRKQVTQVYEDFLADMPASLERKTEKFSMYATFTDDFASGPQAGRAANFMHAFQKLRDSSGLMRFFFPFIRTATRITQAGVKRMPLIGGAIRDTQELMLRGTAEEIALSRAKQALGAGVLTAGLVGTHMGMMTGSAPKNSGDRAVWEEAGFKEYSLVTKRNAQGLPTETVPFKRLGEPWNMLLRLYADGYQVVRKAYDDLANEQVEDTDAVEDAMAGMLIAFSKVAEDSVFFGQASQILSAWADGDEKAVQRWLGQLGSVGPLDDAARTLAPYAKEAQSALDEIRDKTPWGKPGEPMKRNWLGEPYLLVGNALDDELPEVATMAGRMLGLPLPFKADPENQRLAREIVDIDVKNIGLTTTTALGGIKLTPLQKSAYRAVRGGQPFSHEGRTYTPVKDLDGHTMKEALLAMLDDPLYAGSDPALRRDWFLKTVNVFDTLAKQKVRQMFPELDHAITLLQMSP